MLVAHSLTDLWDRYRAGQRTFRNLHFFGACPEEIELEDCRFESVDFDSAELRDVGFRRCTFALASFTRARMTATVAFLRCTFHGVDFSSADIQQSAFGGCEFVRPNFVAARIFGTAFEGCRFQGVRTEPRTASFGLRTTAAGSRETASLADFDTAFLDDAEFSNCRMAGLRFRDSRIERTVFTDCRLDRLSFEGARLATCRVSRCDFAQTTMVAARIDRTTFEECTFKSFSLTGARLEQTAFRGCFMTNVNLSRAVFVASDLAPFCESRDTLAIHDPPVIEWRSICRSLKCVSLHLLLYKCGMPDVLIQYLIAAARAIDPDLLFKLMRSTFISYGGPDRDFAAALRDRLEQNGVRTFFFEKDAVPGERIHRVMYEGLNKFDRVILVCSESSLVRPGVRNEIEETLAREARDGGASYLIPVTRDDYVFESSDPVIARIRDRVVADFRTAPPGSDRFNSSFLRLIEALRTDDGGELAPAAPSTPIG